MIQQPATVSALLTVPISSRSRCNQQQQGGFGKQNKTETVGIFRISSEYKGTLQAILIKLI